MLMAYYVTLILAFEKDWEVAEELNNRTKQNGIEPQ